MNAVQIEAQMDAQNESLDSCIEGTGDVVALSLLHLPFLDFACFYVHFEVLDVL